MALQPGDERPAVQSVAVQPPSVEEQAPTGFGGPAPGENPTGENQYVGPPAAPGSSSPNPDLIRSSPFDLERARRDFNRQRDYGPTATQPRMDTIGPPPAGFWMPEDTLTLETLLLANSDNLTAHDLDRIVKTMQTVAGPEIMELPTQELLSEITKTTTQVVDERTVSAVLGHVPDTKAMSLAILEQDAEVVGSGWSAAAVFEKAQEQKVVWEESTMKDRDKRDAIMEHIGEGEYQAWLAEKGLPDTPGRRGAWGALHPSGHTKEAGERLTDISDKGGMYAVDGDNLAIRFYTDLETREDGSLKISDEDGGYYDVLIRLEPGTEIESIADALSAWNLAEDGVAHTLDAGSQEVPGRQTWLGSVIERTDNAIQAMQRDPTYSVGQANNTRAAFDESAYAGLHGLTSDAEENDRAAMLEQYNRAMTDEALTAAALVQIVRTAETSDDAPARKAVDDARVLWAGIAPEQKEQIKADSFEDFYNDEKIKKEDMSRFGRVLQEDVFDPALAFLGQWEATLQSISVSVLRLSNSPVEMANEFVQATINGDTEKYTTIEGLTELFSPVEMEELESFVEDVRVVGVPLAIDAFLEETKDIGTTADFFGIDPDSGWYGATNLLASVGFDPLTYATAGGVASTRALRQMVLTTAGAEKWLRSRPVLSIAKQLVVKNNPAMVGALAGQGMSSSGIRRLLHVVEATFGTDASKMAGMQEVVNILRSELPAYGGRFIPASATQVLARKNALGLAATFARLSREGTLGGPMWRWATDMLARAPRQRYASINERDWLSNFINQATVFYADDIDSFIGAVRRAVDIDDAYHSGDDGVALLKSQIEQSRTRLGEIGAGVTTDAKSVPQLHQTVKDLERTVAELDEMISRREAAAATARETAESAPGRAVEIQDEIGRLREAGVGVNKKKIKELEDELEFLMNAPEAVEADATIAGLQQSRANAIQMIEETQNVAAHLGAEYSTLHEARLAEERVLKRLEAQLTRYGAGARDRGQIERFIHEFYDEVADTIVDKDGNPRIPIIEGKTHPIFPDLPARDWSRVTGEKQIGKMDTPAGSMAGIDEEVATLGTQTARYPLASGDNVRAVGVGTVAGQTKLPVSVHELLAYKHSSDAMWAFWNENRVGQTLHRAADWMQSIWAMSVLLNLKTSIRSSLDEILRFYEQHGLFPQVSPNQSLWDRARLWNSDNAAYPGGYTTRTVYGGTLPASPRVRANIDASSEAWAFARDQLDTITPTSTGWEIVNPADRGMWVHAERWVNGTLMNDPQFRRFASIFTSSDDDAVRRAAWQEWWDTGGSKMSRQGRLKSGQPITADLAYDVIDQSLDAWLHTVDDAAAVRQTILEAAASNSQVSRSAEFWRKMPHVPGDVSTGVGGLGKIPDKGFEALYGGPQARRGALFYDYHYQSTMSMYDEAYAGKIIDEEWLVANGYANDLSHAQRLVSEGELNPVIRDIVAETGMVLRRDLRESAMQIASVQADNMMYTFGAVSVLGKKMARIFPFGRAQVDYLQWWWKKLTQPTLFRNPMSGATALSPVPGNLRLADRMAKLVTLEEPNITDRAPVFTPAGAINRLTFWPTSLDQWTLVDLSMAPGAFPSWMLNNPSLPEEWRSAAQEFVPGHAMFNEQAQDYGEWFFDMLPKMAVPQGGNSVWSFVDGTRRLFGLVAAYASLRGEGLFLDPLDPLTPDQERRLNAVANAVIIDSDAGPYYRDHAAYNYFQWAQAGNALAMQPTMEADSEVVNDWEALNDQAAYDSIQQDVKLWLDLFGFAEHSGSDLAQMAPVEPMINYIDRWAEMPDGISDATRDSLRYGWEKANAEGATAEDRRRYVNEAYSVLFDELPRLEIARYVAENPGTEIMMSSWYRVIPHLVPEEDAWGVSASRVTATGDEGYQLRLKGYRDGWLIPKDEAQHHYDAMLSAHRATRDNLRRIYQEATGLEWGEQSMLAFKDGKPVIYKEGQRKGQQRKWSLENEEAYFVISKEWWEANRGWLEETRGFNMPDDWVQSLAVSENGIVVQAQEFKDVFSDARGVYTYQYEVDSSVEATLNSIGADARPRTGRYYHGTKTAFPGQTVSDLTYYGKQLYEDIEYAISEMDRLGLGSDPREWPDHPVAVDAPAVKNIGIDEYVKMPPEDRYIIVSRETIRDRLMGAITLSEMDPRRYGFTEDFYNGTPYYRWFGPVGWEAPELPPLSTIPTGDKKIVDPAQVIVEDGDTLKLYGDDGQPVFYRLMGINAPEMEDFTGGVAQERLATLIEGADTVAFVRFHPEMYGRETSSFTKQDGVIVHRDRPLVWLYVDGVPVYDADQFSPTNIRGIATESELPDVSAMFEKNKAKVPMLEGG